MMNNFYLNYIKSFIYPKYLESAELIIQENVGAYDSIMVQSNGNMYRGAVYNLLARLKTEKSKRYISFKMKYIYYFRKLGFTVTTIKSDEEFFRISIDEFFSKEFSETEIEEFKSLLNKIFLETLAFPSFGCCAFYEKCSDKKECVHEDQLYSSACEYRKNLDSGRIFYGKNKNIFIESKKHTEKNKPHKITNVNFTNSMKNKSVIAFPDDYIVIDLETTGFSVNFDEIIEIGAVFVKNRTIVDSFSCLIKPPFEIDDFMAERTGITNEMLGGAPNIADVLPDFLKKLGTGFIVGHHVSFDVNFLNRYSNNSVQNDFIDTLRICRKLYPEMKSRKLTDMVEKFGLNQKRAHRALYDCIATHELFEKCRNDILNFYIDYSVFTNLFKKKKKKSYSAPTPVMPPPEKIDTANLLYNKKIVLTGALGRLTRAEATQAIINLGGKVVGSVTKKTDYLIVSKESSHTSSKYKKTIDLINSGSKIQILTEDDFYKLIEI